MKSIIKKSVYSYNKHSFLLLFLLLFVSAISAQNSRTANEKEKAVINKAVNIIVPLIDGFENDTWQKEEGGADDENNYSVQIHPDVVMGVAPFNDWHFTVRQGSDFYNKNIKPYYDKVTNNPIDAGNAEAMKQLVDEGQKIKTTSNIYVEVHVNDLGIPVKPVKNNEADLRLPGCYISYKQTKDKFIGTDRNLPDSYVLVFGNWGSSKYQNGDYHFAFAHPPGNPFIENIVIIISGAKDRILEILKSTDWTKVNDALTK